eukprot:366433-Chlamydomonas_euryale.AAC.23
MPVSPSQWSERLPPLLPTPLWYAVGPAPVEGVPCMRSCGGAPAGMDVRRAPASCVTSSADSAPRLLSRAAAAAASDNVGSSGRCSVRRAVPTSDVSRRTGPLVGSSECIADDPLGCGGSSEAHKLGMPGQATFMAAHAPWKTRLAAAAEAGTVKGIG